MAVDVIDRLHQEMPEGHAPAVDAAALFAQIVAGPRDEAVRRRPRRPVRRLVVVALVAALAIAAPLAIARGTHLLDVVFGSSPPKQVQTMFDSLLPRDIGPKQGPKQPASQKDLIGSSEKLVAQITTRSGAVAKMYAADLRTGGQCFIALGGPFNGGTCGFSPVWQQRHPLIAVWGSWGAPSKGRFGRRVAYFGRATSPRAASLVMRFEDGAGETVPLSHSWFMYEVPKAHERWGHEPARVDILDAAGRRIATYADPLGLRGARIKFPPIEKPLAGTKHTLTREPLGWRGAFLELQSAKGNRGTQCMRALNTGDPIQTQNWTCRSIANVTIIAPGKVAPRQPVTFESRARTVVNGEPGGYVYFRGWVAPKVASLELRFQDSVVQAIPLHDGLFVYVVPPDRWVLGKRPSYVVARDEQGRAIFRRFLYPRQPCAFPVTEKGCAGIQVVSG